jgi:ankyrin repeat protein
MTPRAVRYANTQKHDSLLAWLSAQSIENINAELWVCAESSNIDKAKACILAGADPSGPSGGEKTTPLTRACIFNQVEMVKFLAPLTDVNHLDLFGSTAAHRCCQNGHHECLKILHEAGADFSIADELGDNVFFEAMRHGTELWAKPHPESLSLSDDYGRCIDVLLPLVDLSAVNGQGMTALTLARDSQSHALADEISRLMALAEKSAIEASTPCVLATSNRPRSI